ncbi:hypothetical protein DFP72DRAFT_970384 [Ephemerocybe angulata]|uniref:F-box domain-containing protein n=1 Tax=Ephemerocybe angulata TaxID=980116 RepID=A0A8H6LZA8_9AGAR|nr:hypothetical protein DFP72DRAFT_970384 [Tulosesus angulatus]
MDQPRLTHLLNNRTALDPLEIKSIRHEVHVRIQAIERLQLELQKLESERAAWQSLLSPLRRNSIPPEILGEIFGYVVLATESTKPRRSQVNVLCRVCKAWRDVALAIPSLWAQLDEIVVRNHLDIAKVRSWLSRSGNAEKTLSLEGKHNPLCPFESPAVRKFLLTGPVLDSLSLKCHSLQCFTRLLNPTPSQGEAPHPRSFDSLQSISLGFSQWPSSPDAWHLLNHLPPVTSLTMDLPEPDEDEDEFDYSPKSPLPRSIFTTNLTKLSLTSAWPMAWILQIVKACTNLENLVLDYGPGVVDDAMVPISSRNRHILLPKLSSLEMREISLRTETTCILRHMVAPSLNALEICYFNDEEPLDKLSLPTMEEFCADILSLVPGHSGSNGVTNLQYLRFKHLPIASASLYRILSAFPTLRHLTLDSVKSDSALFRNRGPGKPLVPELEVLELLNVPPSIYPDDVCSFLIDTGDRPLEKLRLFMTIVHDPSPGDSEEAKMLSEEGTDVTIFYVPGQN